MADAEIDQLIATMRANPVDLAGLPAEVRAAFEVMVSAIPVPGSFSIAPVVLDNVPGLRIEGAGMAGDAALLYLHGGGYVVGSAQGYRGLAAALAGAAAATGYAIDYRLAPEHPCPAAIEDAVAAYEALISAGVAPSRIAIAGDSAGGGLVLATLVALRDAGVPLPAAGLLISPWVDLACEGASICAKAAEDPSLTEQGLRACAAQYAGAGDIQAPKASPVHADLHGLPPLLIQVGSAEILLDDAVSAARAAGAAGVEVHLRIWPRMIHVWHAFGFMLTAGRDAIEEAGTFLSARIAAGGK